MKEKFSWELLLVPIFFLVLILTIRFVWGYLGLPSQDDLIAHVQAFFIQYGLWLILGASILESMLFVGWYFPGSLVIFLGVASTNGNPILAAKTVLTVCLGMLVGYSINFLLGKYGWHKILLKFGFSEELRKIEERVKSKGMLHSFLLYVMPGFGSLLSTAFGVLKFSYPKFLTFTILFVIFWNSIWGVLVYFFGMALFKLLTNTLSIVILFCLYFYYMHSQGKFKTNI
jgi:membrane protein DedA with SNARE-associated domain